MLFSNGYLGNFYGHGHCFIFREKNKQSEPIQIQHAKLTIRNEKGSCYLAQLRDPSLECEELSSRTCLCLFCSRNTRSWAIHIWFDYHNINLLTLNPTSCNKCQYSTVKISCLIINQHQTGKDTILFFEQTKMEWNEWYLWQLTYMLGLIKNVFLLDYAGIDRPGLPY